MDRTTPAQKPADERDLLDRALEALRRRGHAVEGSEPMAGDVSRRRYVRLALRGTKAASTAVLALYPPDLRGTCERSLVSGRLLAEAGVRVATVLTTDCGAGWVLLEDLGEATLYDLADRPWTEIEPFFATAVDLLPRISGLSHDLVAPLNPPLDRDLLVRELSLTREAFLVPAGIDVEPRLWHALERLCAVLGAEPPVPCHRDYGARNLIPLALAEGSAGLGVIGVIDHQDLRMGPPAYDLASLLNDSLFPPAEAEERLLERAGARAPEKRLSYHRAAAQRTLKAVGSYAAFARRGGGRHVGLIGPTLARALEHLHRAPETAPIAPELAALWRGAGTGLC